MLLLRAQQSKLTKIADIDSVDVFAPQYSNYFDDSLHRMTINSSSRTSLTSGMLTRPGKSVAKAERKLWGRGHRWSTGVHIRCFHNLCDNIKFINPEITPSMAVTTLSIHYSTVNVHVTDPSWNIWMAISPQQVIRSTSCLVLGVRFSGSADRMWLFPVWPNPRWRPWHEMTWHDRRYRQEPSDIAFC